MLIDGQEPQAPTHYIVRRNVDPDLVLIGLALTPVDVAIVTNVLDYDYACKICNVVILTSQSEEIRKQIDRPVLIVGEADFIDAVYADGRRESLAARA